jgi:methionyl aminopeptidase
MGVKIKNKEQISAMRESANILKHVFKTIEPFVKTGATASSIDDLIRNTIKSKGAEPSFLGYRGFKYSSCISKNEEVVHGLPTSDKIFFPGDIVSIDMGVYYKGFHSDCARTFMIENVDSEVERLVTITKESFFEAIKYATPGYTYGDIAYALQQHVESAGFSVVRDLCSHGIGSELHEDPLIPNYGKPGQGMTLKPGMTFALEPMVNIGDFNVLTLADKWTIIAADKKWSAHYENTVLITDGEPEILTL